VNNRNLRDELEKLLKHKKSKQYYAYKLGITVDEVEQLLSKIPQKEEETFESTVELEYEPKDDKELAKEHRVNLDKFYISSYYSVKSFSGKFRSTIRAARKPEKEVSLAKFTEFLNNYKPAPFTVNISSSSVGREEVDCEISIADFHLDRLTLQNDTIENRKKEFIKTLNSLILSTTAIYKIRKLVFVIGNDFFNSDNYQGSTTNLTPQSNSVSWDRAYEEGFSLLAQAIGSLSYIAENVHVILIQGNHDRTKSFYIAHALEVFFRNTENVIFDRGNSNIKHIILGNTFIGYHHGNTKIDDLPLLFATSPNTAIPFATAKYREVHTADKHFYMAKEIKGVRMQQIPSMANPSSWETDNNYVNNIRCGLALIYHPIKGKKGEFEEKV